VRGGIWKPSLDASGQLDLQLTTRGATDTSRATLRRARAATATDCSALATDAALARHTLVKAVQTADAQTGLSLYETIDAARDAASTSQAMRSLSRFVPALFGRVGRLKGRPVLLLEDVTAPFRCASWLESKLLDNSSELHMQVAHSPDTCTEILRLYNDTAEPLRAAALPRERTAARALARYARLELERLAAAMRAESDLCFHDASVVVALAVPSERAATLTLWWRDPAAAAAGAIQAAESLVCAANASTAALGGGAIQRRAVPCAFASGERLGMASELRAAADLDVSDGAALGADDGFVVWVDTDVAAAPATVGLDDDSQ